MSKYGKRIAAMGLSTAMVMGLLTGCSSSGADEAVATVDGQEISLGVATFMLRYQQAQTQSYLGALFGSDTNIFEQDLTGSGTAYGDTVKENVISSLKEMTILEQHMSDYNVELTDEDTAAIEAAAKQFIEANDKDTLDHMMATEETVTRYLTLQTIQNKMETAIEADVDTEVSDEEAAQKTIQYVRFTIPETEEETEAEAESETETGSEAESTTESSTGTEDESAAETETETAAETESTADTEAVSEAESTSEETTEAETEESSEKIETREEAQSLIDAVNAGATLEDALAEIDEDKSVTDYSYGDDEDVLDENVIAAADALSDGEIVSEPVETDGAFYVVQMVRTFDEEATADKKDEIVNERKQDLYDSVLEGWEPEEYTVDEDLWAEVGYAEYISLKTEDETETETAAAGETETGSEAESAADTEAESTAQTETESTSEAAS